VPGRGDLFENRPVELGDEVERFVLGADRQPLGSSLIRLIEHVLQDWGTTARCAVLLLALLPVLAVGLALLFLWLLPWTSGAA